MNDITTAVYAGTFDPITNGHLDIIQRAIALFDKLIIAVADSADKQPYFGLAQRLAFARAATQQQSKVTVVSMSGLLVDFMQQQHASVIVRGLRSAADFSSEMPMAMMNRELDAQLETVFLMTSPGKQYISSALVREIMKLKGDVSAFVPSAVIEYLNKQ